MKNPKRKITDSDDAEFSSEYGEITDSGVAPGIRETAAAAVKKAMAYLRTHRILIIRTILPTLYCLLFGGTGFDMGVYPFGISAVCAASPGISALASAAGVLVSSFFVRGGMYIALSAILGAGALSAAHKFKGSALTGSSRFRAGLALGIGVFQAIIFALPGDIGFYDLCSVLLSAVLCPVFAVSLTGVFTSDGRFSPLAKSGIYVIFYTLAYFLRILSPAGQSVSTVLCISAVLAVSYAFGTEKSILLGVAAGFASDPDYSFIYIAAAVGSGILMGISPLAAVVGGAVLALSFGIYSGGAFAFGDIFPELLFAVAVTAPLVHYKAIPSMRKKKAVTSEDGDKAAVTEMKLTAAKKRLTALSGSLGSISSVMKKLSSAMQKPSFDEMRQMCDDAFDESCQFCDGRRQCWDREYRSTAAAINSMATALRRGDPVDEGSLTEGMRNRCIYADSIISRINVGAAARSSAPDATAYMAEDLGAIAELLGEVADGDGEDLDYDADGSHALAIRFEKIGLRAKKISVYGKRRRRVFAVELERGCTAGNDEIRSAAESVLGCAMSSPEYRIDCGRVTMSLHTAPRFSVRLGRCSVPKQGEKCGDSITSFKGDGGYFYSLISDGMGSGGEASVTSGVSAVFLERMLGAGASLTSAMDMLNSFLTRRNTECFTTVDLMEADLITGELRFIKSGAAPSFVLREGRLFRLSSRTVPIGIISPFDAEQIRFTARDGDTVIMLSDGAIPDGDDVPWLYDMLCDGDFTVTPDTDLDYAARLIADKAISEYGSADDITVGVARISLAKREKNAEQYKYPH